MIVESFLMASWPSVGHFYGDCMVCDIVGSRWICSCDVVSASEPVPLGICPHGGFHKTSGRGSTIKLIFQFFLNVD